MSARGIIAPCPWCGSRNVSWVVPAFSSRVRPYCLDCDAQGPTGYVASRADRDGAERAAINAWNGARA